MNNIQTSINKTITASFAIINLVFASLLFAYYPKYILSSPFFFIILSVMFLIDFQSQKCSSILILLSVLYSFLAILPSFADIPEIECCSIRIVSVYVIPILDLFLMFVFIYYKRNADNVEIINIKTSNNNIELVKLSFAQKVFYVITLSFFVVMDIICIMLFLHSLLYSFWSILPLFFFISLLVMLFAYLKPSHITMILVVIAEFCLVFAIFIISPLLLMLRLKYHWLTHLILGFPSIALVMYFTDLQILTDVYRKSLKASE